MPQSTRICKLDYCERIVMCKSLCNAHYYQQHRGKPFTVIGAKRANYLASRFDEQGRKQCASCRQWLAVENFGPNRNKLDRLRSSCNACRREQYRAAAPTSVTRYRKYGLTQESFDAILASQDRRCAICRTDVPGGVGWVLDHDHACCPSNSRKACGRCNRGILCTNCNLGLGQFGDDPQRLSQAIEYLSIVRGV